MSLVKDLLRQTRLAQEELAEQGATQDAETQLATVTELAPALTEIQELGEEIEGGEAAVTSLNETVASLEAFKARGYVTEAELFMAVSRGQRVLKRYGIEAPSLEGHSLATDADRLQQLQYATEGFRETADKIGESLRTAFDKLKEKFKDTLEQMVNVNVRAKAKIVQLNGKLNSLEGDVKNNVIKLSSKAYRHLADEHGRFLAPTQVATKLQGATKEILQRYPEAIVAAGNGKTPVIKESVLQGLPAGIALVEVKGVAIFTTTKAADVSARKAIPVVKPNDLTKVLSCASTVIELLAVNDGVAKIFKAASVAEDKEYAQRMYVMAGHLLDFYFYAQRVNSALISYVEAQVDQYK